MRNRAPRLLLALPVVFAVACARDEWPQAPAVDQAAYDQEYERWREGQEETARASLAIVGTWPLQEGDTPFGTNEALPVVLPAKLGVARAGVITRRGEGLVVTPAPGVRLRDGDGAALAAPITGGAGTTFRLQSFRFETFPAGPTLLLTAIDEEHPDLEHLRVDAFPVDLRWRVAARFEAFDTPRMLTIQTTQATASEMPAPGQLVFRLGNEESRLTVIGEPGDEQFFVMFKDATNGSSTYGGYRILLPDAVPDGEWTVLDFNLAQNPPCAYSPYTMCPLPPRENRLATAVEAGAKRHPTARGFAGLP